MADVHWRLIDAYVLVSSGVARRRSALTRPVTHIKNLIKALPLFSRIRRVSGEQFYVSLALSDVSLLLVRSETLRGYHA